MLFELAPLLLHWSCLTQKRAGSTEGPYEGGAEQLTCGFSH